MNEYTVIEKHDGWAEVVLSRPARKNAIVPPMAIEVATAVNGRPHSRTLLRLSFGG